MSGLPSHIAMQDVPISQDDDLWGGVHRPTVAEYRLPTHE
jgi:hypothetical protein